MGKWANMFLAYNLGGEKCKELAKANKLKMSKSQRFKAPSTFELADGSWVVEIYLDDVVVTSNTFWGSVVLPTIKADGSSAGVAAVYAAAQAWYITEYSGGELAPEAGAAALNQIFSAAGQASAVMGLYYIMNY